MFNRFPILGNPAWVAGGVTLALAAYTYYVVRWGNADPAESLVLLDRLIGSDEEKRVFQPSAEDSKPSTSNSAANTIEEAQSSKPAK